MRFAYDNFLETNGLLTADSQYSSEFAVENVVDRRLGKKWRNYRAPNLILNADCDKVDSPCLDSPVVACTGGTWAIDYLNKYSGDASWRLTKTGVADAVQYLQDGSATNDMHGLTAGITYELRARIFSTAAVGKAYFAVYEYYAAAWHYKLLATTAVSTWHFRKLKFTVNAATTGIILDLEISTTEAAGTIANVNNMRLYESNDEIEHGSGLEADCPSLDNGYSGLGNATWVSQIDGWYLTKTTAGGGGASIVYLEDNVTTTDMHGMIAGKTYKVVVDFYAAVTTLTNTAMYIYEYYAAAWHIVGTIYPTVSYAFHTLTATITINSLATGIKISLEIASVEAVNHALIIRNFSLILEARIFLDAYPGKTLLPTIASVIGHNLSATAVVKIQGNATPLWDAPSYDHTFTTWDIDLMLEFMAAATYRYWSIWFDDDNNEDGYIEIGYSSLGTYDQYDGITPDLDHQIEDKSIISETEGGAVTGSKGVLLDHLPIIIPDVTYAIKTLLETMIEYVHKYRPFIWVADEDSLTYFPARFMRFTEFNFPHIGGYQLWDFKAALKECK